MLGLGTKFSWFHRVTASGGNGEKPVQSRYCPATVMGPIALSQDARQPLTHSL